MALNWVMLDDNRNPIPLQGEISIPIPITDVDCTLSTPLAPAQSSTSNGGAGRTTKKESGKVMLTDKRLIFVGQSNSRAKPSFESLSIPLESILSSKFEQPYFSSNYLALDVKPSEGGRLPHGTTVEIRSPNSGIYSFLGVLEKTRERAMYMRRQSLDDDENLPAYSSSSTAAAISSHHGDMPPSYDA